MPDEPVLSVAGGRRRLRYTRFGLAIGVAAAAAILFITFMMFLPGTQTQANATGAAGAAFLMAMIAGLPTSLASAPFIRALVGTAGWVGIAAMPILNAVMIGAVVDAVRAISRTRP